MRFLIFILFCVPAYAALPKDVLGLAQSALDKDLGSSEDGQICGVRSLEGLERESGDDAGFVVSGFVSAPYVGCSGQRLFHCRLAYNSGDGHDLKLVSRECDLATRGGE